MGEYGNIMKEQHKYFCLSVIILLSFILLGVLELKPGWARSVIKTIDVGGEPIDLEYNPSNKYIYVANFDSDDVSVIASVTNIVIKTIDIGTGPWDLEYNPSNKRIYSANHWSDTVSVIGSSTIIIGQAPNAGLDLKVESGTIVQLDGDMRTSSNS